MLPLLSGFFYAVGMLLAKRAFGHGFGVMRYVFLSNMMMLVMFLPLLYFVKDQPDWNRIGWPILCGTGFFLGQVFTFLAIRWGDVSVQAPVMGTKVVFVATFSVILQAGPVPLSWWVGAMLTTVAIFLLSYTTVGNRKGTLFALVLALTSAACFGAVDVVLQREAHGFGPLAYIILMMATSAVLSLGLIPFFKGRLRDMNFQAWKWGLLGTSIIAFQSLGIALTISLYGRATAVNILYSSRGLWSIVLVWAVGSWFASRESEVGTKIMLRRLAGSSLLCVAIVLVLMEGE